MLGIRPILGRNFLPEEESKGDVVMVTESFWRKHFNSDPTILGRTVTLNGVPNTIIGVLPNLPISWFGRDSEIFANKPFEPSGITKERLMRGVSFMRVTAQLKPGVSISQAQAAMPARFQSYKEQHPETALQYSVITDRGRKGCGGDRNRQRRRRSRAISASPSLGFLGRAQ